MDNCYPRKADVVVPISTLSPFRYPGGKTWFLPRIRTWLASHSQQPTDFVEPFAGGASVGLMVAREKLADHVTLVEIDKDIAAVWRVVINGEGDVDQLIKNIQGYEVTKESVQMTIDEVPRSLTDHAFQTILRNRVSRGGIMAPGSGLLKRGENDRGLASRWYPETLAERILTIVGLRNRITFIEGDAFAVLRKASGELNTVFFIDPPYSATENGAGKRLYTHSEIDHEALFDLASKLKGDFLMTYDSDDRVRTLALQHDFIIEEVVMRNTHYSLKTELVISKAAQQPGQHPDYGLATIGSEA